MSEPRNWLEAVATAHAAGATQWTTGRVSGRRLGGGWNNALYRIAVDGQEYACKLCVADERRRAAREYGALRLLWAAGLDIAPEPILLDESATVVPLPAVLYRWVSGVPLGPRPTQQQLEALLDSYQAMEQLRPDAFPDHPLPTAWFHWFDFTPYMAELGDMLNRYGPWLAATNPEGPSLCKRMARLADQCVAILSQSTVDPGHGRFPLRLCHVDANLGNAIWGEDDRLRWVDWEYSGWGDPALNLAELRWHGALGDLGPAEQAWLRDSYRRPAGDPTFDSRLALWDRLLSTRWPLLVLRWLWSCYNGPDQVRLTRPADDPAELRARLVRFVERAERFATEEGEE